MKIHPRNWKPISKAPKDGTFVLLYYPKLRKKMFVGYYHKTETYVHGKLKYKCEGWRIGMDMPGIFASQRPTCWMPLPPPPKRQ